MQSARSNLSINRERAVSSPIRIRVAPAVPEVDEDSPAVLVLDSHNNFLDEIEGSSAEGEDTTLHITDDILPKVEYMPALLHYAQYFGLAWVHGGEIESNGALPVLRKIPAVVVFGMSILQVVWLLKTIFNMEGSEPSHYVLFGYFVTTLFTRLAFIGAQIRKQSLIQNLLETLTKDNSSDYKCCNKKFGRFASFLLLLSLAVSLCMTCSGVGIVPLSEWNWDDIVQFHMEEMRSFLNLPSFNSTEVAGHDGQEFRLADYVLGYISIMADVCGRLVDNFILDLLLSSSLTAADYAQWFTLRCNELKCSNDFDESSSHGSSVELPLSNFVGLRILRLHQRLGKIAEKIEKAFGTLFKFSHVGNLIVCAYFIREAVVDKNVGVLMGMSVRIAKLCVILYVASKASKMNTELRKLVKSRRKTWFSSMDSSDIHIILDDLTITPFGIGTGSFHIEETFIAKFLGIVISYFFILNDSQAR